ncbi:MAG: ribonuclease P protein subunit [Candidatus Caldarchaeum sp.]|nr:ribonuclease P protein subunit [Candidatus Caldarchaeum sp.]
MNKSSSVFLLGRRVRVSFGGKLFEGVVVAETKNTVSVSTSSGEKTIPKRGSVFWLLDDGEVKIEGSTLVGRPVDRLLRGV